MHADTSAGLLRMPLLTLSIQHDVCDFPQFGRARILYPSVSGLEWEALWPASCMPSASRLILDTVSEPLLINLRRPLLMIDWCIEIRKRRRRRQRYEAGTRARRSHRQIIEIKWRGSHVGQSRILSRTSERRIDSARLVAAVTSSLALALVVEDFVDAAAVVGL